MFDCNICNKTYKNMYTLKTHYNSNTHKTNVESHNKILEQKNHTASNSVTISSDNSNNRNIHKNTTAEARENINPNTSHTSNNTENVGKQMLKCICIGCWECYNDEKTLSTHHLECEHFLKSYIMSTKLGINLDLCIKTILTHKLQEKEKECTDIRNKISILDKYGGNTTFDANNQDNLVPRTVLVREANDNKKVEANWCNFKHIRPLYEENMTQLRHSKIGDKVLLSGKDCFKTLIDIVYNELENMNVYIADKQNNLAMYVNVNGDINVTDTDTVVDTLVQKYIDYIINMFAICDMSMLQTYKDIGIIVITDGDNIFFITERLVEYKKYIYDKLLLIEEQAKKNINLLGDVKYRLLGTDKKLFNFTKYSLYSIDTVHTHKLAYDS